MRTAGLVLAALIAWVLLVIIVNALLPGTSEMAGATRGGIYLFYIVAAITTVLNLRRSKVHTNDRTTIALRAA